MPKEKINHEKNIEGYNLEGVNVDAEKIILLREIRDTLVAILAK